MNYDARHETYESLNKRIEKANELLKQPIKELKHRFAENDVVWLNVTVGERCDVNLNGSIGLATIQVLMSYNGRKFVASRSIIGLTISLESPKNAYDVDDAIRLLEYLKRAEETLRKEFNEIIEPLIPESIWNITA